VRPWARLAAAAATSGSATGAWPPPSWPGLGARSHLAEARQLRRPPHPATRGSSAPRACLGPRAHGVLWAGSCRRVPWWVSLFPRGSAREGCARSGVQGVDPLLLISAWQPSTRRGQPSAALTRGRPADAHTGAALTGPSTAALTGVPCRVSAANSVPRVPVRVPHTPRRDVAWTTAGLPRGGGVDFYAECLYPFFRV
jgi:hypothetical protein